MSNEKKNCTRIEEKNSFKHFKLISEGGSYSANHPSPPKCQNTIQVTKDCKTSKQKDNWRASSGDCISPDPNGPDSGPHPV